MIPWKPADELIQGLHYEFDEDSHNMVVELFGEFFTRVSIPDWTSGVGPRNIEEFLTRSSSDCVLRTRCGCEKHIVLPHKDLLRGYLVPLREPIRGVLSTAIVSDMPKLGRIREFVWDRRYDSNHFKILEERPA